MCMAFDRLRDCGLHLMSQQPCGTLTKIVSLNSIVYGNMTAVSLSFEFKRIDYKLLIASFSAFIFSPQHGYLNVNLTLNDNQWAIFVGRD